MGQKALYLDLLKSLGIGVSDEMDTALESVPTSS